MTVTDVVTDAVTDAVTDPVTDTVTDVTGVWPLGPRGPAAAV